MGHQKNLYHCIHSLSGIHHCIHLVLHEEPLVIEDIHGRIVAWYLPGILSSERQVCVFQNIKVMNTTRTGQIVGTASLSLHRYMH
jgi:hypothetical protein